MAKNAGNLNSNFVQSFQYRVAIIKTLVRRRFGKELFPHPQSYTHVIHPGLGVSRTFSTHLSTGRLAPAPANGKAVEITENAKRPSAETRRPPLIRPLAATNGGTVPESTDGRTAAAIMHLHLIRKNAVEFVRLAFVYGVTVDQIALESGLSVITVQWILAGGDR